MGLRGPKPGWKLAKAKAEAQAAAAEAAPATKKPKAKPKAPPPKRMPKRAPAAPARGSRPPAYTAPMVCAHTPLEQLSGYERNNPRYLSGEALKTFAHQRGLPKSTVADKGDAWIREQLRYIEANRQEAEA